MIISTTCDYSQNFDVELNKETFGRESDANVAVYDAPFLREMIVEHYCLGTVLISHVGKGRNIFRILIGIF